MKEIREMGEITQQREEGADLIHVYRPHYWFFSWVSVVLCLLFMLLVIGSLISSPGDIEWLNVIVVLIVLGTGNALLFKAALDIRIIVTDKYFEYYGIGYRVRARWKDLLRVEMHRWEWKWGTRNPERLILRRAIVKGPKWLRWIVRFTGQAQMIWIGQFDPWWRKSALGDDIRYFAPHLNI